MDEWVNVERIDLSSGPVEEPSKELDTMLDLNGRERKVTRNLKRKHDEINHVQKVLNCCMLNVPVHVLPESPKAAKKRATSNIMQVPSKRN